MTAFENYILSVLETDYGTDIASASVKELYTAASKAAVHAAQKKRVSPPAGRRACYLSAEFLTGRLIYNNLLNLGLLDETSEILKRHGISPAVFEDVEDAALGNGGLGRLAACFLDSAATLNLPLNGYGIRYRYGLFKQRFEDGFQTEYPDDWLAWGDPWSVRRDDESVRVRFADMEVLAVPYDMPVIGHNSQTVNTLRLWQSEAEDGFDLAAFNSQDYPAAFRRQYEARAISSVLYPNDDTAEGKLLRLRQQYFFVSATLQHLVREYKRLYGPDLSRFGEYYVCSLNDTHPVIAIPEFCRIFMDEEGMSFESALATAKQTFAYTNHTIMPEALEKWYVPLFKKLLPRVYEIIQLIDAQLQKELPALGVKKVELKQYRIISDRMVHMARLALYSCFATNGVAAIHTDILKTRALPEWYRIFPERFSNKTNGVTQRRWLALCNPALSTYITGLIGGRWVTKLDNLKNMERYKDDKEVLTALHGIKQQNKAALAEYIEKAEGITLDPSFIFDIQIKRLHEYKRQLLNAFSILHIYYELKAGSLPSFMPTAYIFGAKAAAGYFRAKGTIKYINEVASLVNNDPETNGRLKVVFVQNYNVSYAERLIPAADISEQISAAGTEASGTGNMKMMMNGAVTLGTYDGANVEIVQNAGMENNYIFGARVEELEALGSTYNPVEIYKTSSAVRRVVDSLIDGTFDDGGTGMFDELYFALLRGASWHTPDHYYLLLDFESYVEAKLKTNRDYGDTTGFSKKCLMNIANSGNFSSDRTVRQYAEEIWKI